MLDDPQPRRPIPPLDVPHRHATEHSPLAAANRPTVPDRGESPSGPTGRRSTRSVVRTIATAGLAFALGAGAIVSVDAFQRGPEPQIAAPTVIESDTARIAPLSQTSSSARSQSVRPDGTEPYADAAQILNPSIVQIRHDGSVGSGVIYGEQGLIVTNAHVVGDATEVSVRVSDGRRVVGRVIGIAAPADIAVVALEQDLGMPPAALAVGEPLRVGQIVVAMGSPYGFEQSVSAGIVSAVNRPVPSPTGHLIPMIQTDASINPGNSGGALADRNGAVIGLNSSIRTDSGGGSIGIGFAIPIDIVVDIADRLVEGEPFTPGFLGASGVDAVAPVAGVLVTEVRPEGPAQLGGVEEGDIIVGFGAKRIQTAGQLGAKVLVTPPGTSMAIAVVRDGEERTVDIIVGAGQLPERAPATETSDPTGEGDAIEPEG